MKNRTGITTAVIGFCMFLSACSKTPVETPDVQKNTESSAYTEAADTESTEEETVGEEATADETEAAESIESDSPVTDGGSPWIDSDLKENLAADMQTDPRDDFHLYANKDWLLETEIPDGHQVCSMFDERELTVKKQCIELLKDESIEGHDAELIRTFNSLLLDWGERADRGISDLEALYSKILRIQTTEDVDALFEDRSNMIELPSFVNARSTIGNNDPEHYIVYIDSPDLLLGDSAEYLERSTYGDMKYGLSKDAFTYVAGKFGMPEEDAEKCFDDAIDFETLLADSIMSTQETNSNDYYEKINVEMTLDDLTDHCKNYPLGRILNTLGYSYDGVYWVGNPGYLIRLDELYTDENIQGIRAVLLVNYLLDYAEWLDQNTYDHMQDLKSRYLGINGKYTDEEMAYNTVSDFLPASLQKVYVRKYGSEDDREKMEVLCREVTDTYREMLSENDWVSEELKEAAIQKLNHLTICAAYPDKFRDTSSIDIKDCSLIEARRKIIECGRDYNRSLIGAAKDQEMWADDINILFCGAYYDPTQNAIIIPIGIMGDPFYAPDMSAEELFASIGSVIGHEISHAFDNNGSQFDENGALNNWWPDADAVVFQKRVEKVVDYLDNIVAFGEEHFIGSNIDGEMIADITGLQCLLKMASKKKDFDYDRFFVRYAQRNKWLSLFSYEYETLTQDEHPLFYARTNVSVQQFEEFYETYDVKKGDNMYLAPEDRLIVW